MLSHEAGRNFILSVAIKKFKYSVMVIGRGLFLSLFAEINMKHWGDLKLISNIPCEGMRGFHFMAPGSHMRELTQISYIPFAELTLIFFNWKTPRLLTLCSLFFKKTQAWKSFVFSLYIFRECWRVVMTHPYQLAWLNVRILGGLWINLLLVYSAQSHQTCEIWKMVWLLNRYINYLHEYLIPSCAAHLSIEIKHFILWKSWLAQRLHIKKNHDLHLTSLFLRISCLFNLCNNAGTNVFLKTKSLESDLKLFILHLYSSSISYFYKTVLLYPLLNFLRIFLPLIYINTCIYLADNMCLMFCL